MSRQEILEKAIQRAIEGGCELNVASEYVIQLDNHGYPYLLGNTDLGYWITGYHAIIFSHDFAKALWGDHRDSEGTYLIEQVSPNYKRTYGGPAWQYHLQQMVIADDPIKYLGEHR